MRNWGGTVNLAGIPPGSARSIAGYAAESLAIGRALLCGYNLFFKAWRDSKYDAVLDTGKALYRIEIKGTTKAILSLTGGGRAGEQMAKDRKSREKILSRSDSHFILGVHSLTGRCWILPTEFVEILGKKKLGVSSLACFEEKWEIFAPAPGGIPTKDIQAGFGSLSEQDLCKLAKRVGVSDCKTESRFRLGSARAVEVNRREYLVLTIWIAIFTGLK